MLLYVSMKFKGTEWLVPNSLTGRAGWKGCSEPRHPTGGWTNLCAFPWSHVETMARTRNCIIPGRDPQTDKMSPIVSWDNCLMRLFLLQISPRISFKGRKKIFKIIWLTDYGIKKMISLTSAWQVQLFSADQLHLWSNLLFQHLLSRSVTYVVNPWASPDTFLRQSEKWQLTSFYRNENI